MQTKLLLLLPLIVKVAYWFYFQEISYVSRVVMQKTAPDASITADPMSAQGPPGRTLPQHYPINRY